MPVLLYGLDACPVSSGKHRSLNRVVVSCARNIFNVNTSDIAAECIQTCGVDDIADAVAMRKDKFIRIYLLSSSIVSGICSLIVK